MYINVQYQFKGSLPAVLPAGLDGDGVSEKKKRRNQRNSADARASCLNNTQASLLT